MDTENNKNYRMLMLTLAAVLCAVLPRLIGLGGPALTLAETENALAALRLYSESGGSQLLYLLPTSLIFKCFGDTEFTARLVPAMAGMLLAMMPLFARKRLGNRKALLLTAALALDPVLVFWSKRADAVMPVMALLAAAFTAFLSGKVTLALFCFLMALAGGERCLPVVILAGLCGGFFAIRHRDKVIGKIRAIRKRNILTAVILFFLLAAGFGTLPGGIGIFAAGLAKGFTASEGWQYPGIAGLLMTFAVYCGIPFLLSAASFIRRRTPLALGVCFFSSILLVLWQGIAAFPWLALLFWISGIGTLDRLIRIAAGGRGFAFYLAAFFVPCAFAFLYFRLVEMFRMPNGGEFVQLTWNGTVQTLPVTRFAAALLLSVVSVLIVVLVVRVLMGFFNGHSIYAGLIAGLLVICGWGLYTNLWTAGGFDRSADHPAGKRLYSGPVILGGNDVSFVDPALFEKLDETIAKHGDTRNTSDDPMLAWRLRKNAGIVFQQGAVRDLSGIELILDASGASYAGRGFIGTSGAYRGSVGWNRMGLRDWGNWLLFGDAAYTADAPLNLWITEKYILMNEQ